MVFCANFTKKSAVLASRIFFRPLYFTDEIMKSVFRLAIVALCLLAGVSGYSEYPVQRPPRTTPVAAEGYYSVFPDQLQQVIWGFGFEIQSDFIASGNKGLPQATTSVPHDLTPAERERFYHEMLKGFRYCRLAGGLYWRGLGPEQKYLEPRWPEQLAELREMIQAARIQGVDFEYWSPAPFWKASYKFTGGGDRENVLRCSGRNFANDPEYHGDVNRFLKDFAEACRHDLETLRANGIPIAMWGLQNEPFADTPYSSCKYTYQNYATTFEAVVPVVRAFDPKIKIIADTGLSWKFPYIRPVLNDPDYSKLVDALVLHKFAGSDANALLSIPPEKSGKPRFENEFEYFNGPTSPARCLNTVQQIMNWFQIGRAPTWFWIHALKPIGNAEASGYALGFWRPPADTNFSTFSGLKPGHWTWNPYNWYAVGSFVRHMPWNCQAVKVKEQVRDPDLRIFAFKKPDGKLTIVLSNRSFHSHTFQINTGLKGTTFKGYRYTPYEAGTNCMGVDVGTLKGGTISPRLKDLTWEFWEQQ